MGLLLQSFRRARLAAVLGLVGVASCNMETTAPPFDANAFFTASIDGTPFEANYQVQRVIGELRPDVLVLSALDIETNNSARAVTIFIRGFDGPGVYPLGVESETGSWAYVATSPDIRVAGGETFYITSAAQAGSVTVTSWNEGDLAIKGSFTFTAVLEDSDPAEPIELTNGQFSGLLQRVR